MGVVVLFCFCFCFAFVLFLFLFFFFILPYQKISFINKWKYLIIIQLLCTLFFFPLHTFITSIAMPMLPSRRLIHRLRYYNKFSVKRWRVSTVLSSICFDFLYFPVSSRLRIANFLLVVGIRPKRVLVYLSTNLHPASEESASSCGYVKAVRK